jgi:hypothetical protein
MSKLELLSTVVAQSAFPGRDGDDQYAFDIVSIIDIVLTVLEDCDLSPQQTAERAAKPTIMDRVRIRKAARTAGYRGREIRKVSEAIEQCCQAATEADLSEAINEAGDV